MINVYGLPTPEGASRQDGAGIQQVVLAMARHLPDFGYGLVETRAAARLLAHHAGNGNGETDVAHCHGLYPTAELNNDVYHEINARVINDIRAASAVTVPSQWVADLFRRDMHIDPHVIGWGVDLETWQHNEPNKGYVLWNKNRTGDVCDPQYINRLAAKFPSQQFVSTFADPAPNMYVSGLMAHAQMQTVIKRANVYLATTKETGDIGSREALAAGVPVLGFAHGALLDIVQHGVNGFLAAPGDFDGLCAGLDYVTTHRDVLSRNAKHLAQVYSWHEVARQMAGVYDGVLEDRSPIKVSVVIPTYNYGHFVADAIKSACEQKTNFEFEVVAIDNASTDNTQEILSALEQQYDNFHWEYHPVQGVAHARNAAIDDFTQGDLIACLDADDMMGEGFLQICADLLERERSVGIAYARIQTTEGVTSQWLAGEFDYEAQLQGRNQIPSLCMFRRVWWQRAGGFRQHMHPAEDADLWLRMTSLGALAKKATDKPLYIYRFHEDSASAPVRRMERREPDWSGKGWIKSGNIPFAAPKARGAYPVRNYDKPDVSVIIPVGPGHELLLADALDSIEGQSFVNWECIVVNDTGKTWDSRPYVRTVETRGKTGAGNARNAGLATAAAPTVVFLDADDYLMPDFLSLAWRRYRETGDYVYTDWYGLWPDGKFVEHETPEFEPGLLFKDGAFHAVTALLNKRDVESVGGFDASLESWEDVEFYMRLIANGHCGTRVASPQVVYRITTGARRDYGVQLQEILKPEFTRRYAAYVSGEKVPVCGCRPKQTYSPNGDNEELVKVLYSGPRGNHQIHGRITRTYYGVREGGQEFFMRPDDALAEPHKFAVLTEIVADKPQTVTPKEPEVL